jgi:hypothetical protein
MELDFQTGVAFGMLAIVLVYLTNRFVVKPFQKSKTAPDHNCGPDCKCE